MDTYLSTIVDQFAAAGPALDAALEAAGLAPLVDWLQGEPRPPFRETNTPYGWFELVDSDDVELPEDDQLQVGEFLVSVWVVLVLGAPTPADLVDLVSHATPVVAGVLESLGLPYDVWCRRISPGPRSTKAGLVRLVALDLVVRGERELGGVS